MDLKKDSETGVWHVYFYTDKGPRSRSTKATSKTEAEEIVKKAKIAEIEMAAKARALNAESLTAIMAGRKVSCEDAIAEWASWKRVGAASENTIRTQLFVLRGLIDGMEKSSVAKITTEQINEFINAKDGTTLANRQLRLGAIRSLFKFCSAKAYVVGDPASLAKINLRNLSHKQKEPKRREPITEQEYQKIMKVADGFWSHATALSYWAGLRLSDICNLEWDSITAKEIVVHTLKTGARVALPMSDPLIGSGALAMHILSMMEEGGGKYVFPEQRKVYKDPDRRGGFSVYYGRLLTKAGVEGKSFHCLRHSFVTRLGNAGRTLEEIGRFVGHSDTKTTEGYSH